MTETKIQQHKIDAVAELKEGFEGFRSFLFTDYRGLNVEQITELRRSLREVGAEFHVVKNNYAKIAFRQMDHEDAAPFMAGPTAIAYCGDEAGPPAKAILALSREMPLELKGGLLDGEICSAADVEAFSKLPGRLELIQMLMGTMQAPVRGAAAALNAVVSKLVRTLDAVRESKSKEV